MLIGTSENGIYVRTRIIYDYSASKTCVLPTVRYIRRVYTNRIKPKTIERYEGYWFFMRLRHDRTLNLQHFPISAGARFCETLERNIYKDPDKQLV